ncbi:MAG TPA: hypothetical protein VFS58_02055 [Steroidobacteraceae bacterium]|nr:hypothetical protein [Steroidobacteraceae bacterium]
MNIERKSGALLFGLFVAALGIPHTANAVNLRTVVGSIYQVGNGSLAKIGHTAIASTSFNQLYAGGSYTAGCGSPGMVPITGQNFQSTWNINGGLQLYVTIPEYQPYIASMPGFYEVARRGQSINCVYNWTSRAVEGGYSIGFGGVSFQVGSGERSEGGSQPFIMNIPGVADEDEWTSCLP